VPEFSGKVGIVTGSGQGINKAIAERLAALGASVVIVDINEGKAAEVVRGISSASGDAFAIKADVTDKSAVDRLVSEVVTRRGQIDILVNGVGWTAIQPFLDDTLEYWQRVISTNFLGTVQMCSAVLPTMIKQRDGAVVNLASDAARTGMPRQSVYAGSKAAVIGFSKSLAREVAEFGIRVNVVSPHLTDTPMVRAAMTEERIQQRSREIPIGRIAQPADHAEAVAFLVSARASYITGQVLSVNGGAACLG
jgi:2-hydroxycyclohexanecarboxyl-CoA dehydrogenase